MGALSPTVRTLLSLVIVTAIFFLMGREMLNARAELKDYLTDRTLLQSAIYLAFMALSQLILIQGWSLLLKLHGAKAPFRSIMHSFSVPNLGKYIPGKIVFLLARIEMARGLGVSRSVALQCFVLENLYIAATAGLVSLPVVLSHLGVSDLPVLGAVCIASAVLLVLLFRSSVFYQLVTRLLIKLKMNPVDISNTRRFDTSLMVNYLVLWIVYGLAGAVVAVGIFGVPAENSFLIGSAFVAAWLGGYLAFITPGGLGVREGLLVMFLAPILGPAEASALAILTRIIWSLSELAVSLLAVVFYSRHGFSLKH